MTKIALILPYFGKLPDFFQLWLKSCGANPSIDWFVFTDDDSNFDYPPNVHRKITTFEALRKRIQSKFDFPICLPFPYKLCDYKPAYGLIFSEELSGYEFWGYCDCDLIFGNIRKFITEKMLKKYDRIFSRGHLTLIRNNDECSKFFMQKLKGFSAFDNVFKSPQTHSFDEYGVGNGTSHIWRQIKPDRFFDKILFDDIAVNKTHFVSYQKVIQKMPGEPKQHVCFIWKNGKLFRHFDKGSEETLYAHFQKRPLKLSSERRILAKTMCETGGGIVFVPDVILPYAPEWITEDKLRKKYCKTRLFCFRFLKIRIKNLKKKIFVD